MMQNSVCMYQNERNEQRSIENCDYKSRDFVFFIELNPYLIEISHQSE